MTAKDLKNALLQEAVQGKLVPQIASEGNAKDLLEEIRKARHSELVSESKNKPKKEKPLPEITEEEIPFDIPENWCWCRLEEIVDLRSGNQYKETSSGTLYLKVADLNLQENCYEIKTSTRYTNSNDDSFIPQYSIIFPKRGGAIATNKKKLVLKEKVYVDSNTMGMTPKNKDLLPYLNMWFDSIDLGKLSTGTSVPQINNKDLLPLAFPLPPLAEQKRIVATIEKFIPLIEEYGKKETELKTFNEQIGTLTKKAILQEAVQGKLVPQISAEGNAKDLLEEIKKEKAKLLKEGKIKKEKPLPEITEDEIPFDIPQSWCWCRLGEVFEITMGQSPEGTNVGESINGMEFHQGKIFFTDKWLAKSNQKTSEITKIAEPNSILLCMRAPVGKVNLTDRQICIGRGLSSINPRGNISVEWAYYLFETLENEFVKKSTGSTFKAITGDIVKSQLVPLPPLAEQKRIVVAIEKLLPLCDKLGE